MRFLRRRPPEVGVMLHDWLQVLLYVRLVLLRDDVAQVVSDGVEPLVSRLLHQKNNKDITKVTCGDFHRPRSSSYIYFQDIYSL